MDDESINNPRNRVFLLKVHNTVKISMREAQIALFDGPNAVSYTHLTLPTMAVV